MIKLALFTGILIAFNTLASPNNKRLIEIYPGASPQWLNSQEIEKLSHHAHEQGRCAGFMDVTDSAPAAEFIDSPLFLNALEPRQHKIVEPLLTQVKSSAMNEFVK